MRPAGRADAARVKRALLLTLLVLLALPSAARAAACTPQPGSPTCAAWTGKVAFVDDGDTIDVDVAGDGTAHPVRVRLIGIQAMEQTVYSSVATRRRGQCHAVEATARLDQLIRAGRGRVRLTAQDIASQSRGRPERSVAVKIRGAWRDAGLTLVREGLVMWQANANDYAWNAAYNRATQLAKRERRGLWNDHYCGAGPSAGARLSLRVNWDARGDDNVNIDGEWVEIANRDPFTDVPLGGWWLRDSALRRYTFPKRAVVPALGTVTLFVGSGQDDSSEFFWGLPRPAFENETGDERAMGDGAYLFDPQGDLRAGTVYPCLVACS
jgi:micrococcal nuclease